MSTSSRTVIPFLTQIACLLAGLEVAAAQDAPSLQEMIDKAAPGGEVLIPKGVWTVPLVINKPVKLRGEAGAVIRVKSDQPAVRIHSREPAIIESVNIQWERITSERSAEPQAAMVVRDSPVGLRNVVFEATGGTARSPSGLLVLGLSEVELVRCSFEGFDFAAEFGGGAKGRVLESVVWKPGHAGITAGTGAAVEVVGCIVAGSGYHGIRCTGGFLAASNNIVLENKNRGFYLGNQSATGMIRNNAILGNGTGISGFAQSEVEIMNNLIAQSDYAGLDARDSCRLRVHHNILLDNTRGLVLFPESGRNRNLIGPNIFWGNKNDAEGFEEMPERLAKNPDLKDPRAGDFTLKDQKIAEEYGLRGPEGFKALWDKWTEWQRLRADRR